MASSFSFLFRQDGARNEQFLVWKDYGYADEDGMNQAANDRYTEELRLFLAESLGLEIREMPQPGEWAGTGNTIGGLGLRVGLLSIAQVDAILERQQRGSAGRFGEIAIELSFMDATQCRSLLELQRFHLCLDQAGFLLLSQQMDLAHLLELLAQFFSNQTALGAIENEARPRSQGR